MNEPKLIKILKKLKEELPYFSDGRIDYSNSKIAPVIKVFVKYSNKVLLLKRSDKVATYKNKWNTVAGYIDEIKPVKQKAMEELQEELGRL